MRRSRKSRRTVTHLIDRRPQLTQKAPNRDKVTKQINLGTVLPAPEVHTPTPAPARPKPRMMTPPPTERAATPRARAEDPDGGAAEA